MSDFQAILDAIANDPAEDTIKLALCDFCEDELSSSELAEVVRAKVDLLAYPPVQGMMRQWVRNPCQAADDLRQRIRDMEAVIIEDDDLENYLSRIEFAFGMAIAIRCKREWDQQRKRMWIADAARQTSMKPAKGEEERVNFVDELEEIIRNEGFGPVVEQRVNLSTPEGQRQFEHYATQYTDVTQEQLVERMRTAIREQEVKAGGVLSVYAPVHRRKSKRGTDAVAGEVSPAGSD